MTFSVVEVNNIPFARDDHVSVSLNSVAETSQGGDYNSDAT